VFGADGVRSATSSVSIEAAKAPQPPAVVGANCFQLPAHRYTWKMEYFNG